MHATCTFGSNKLACISNTANEAINLLKNTFVEPIISPRRLMAWPRKMCDLTPPDFFFLWTYVVCVHVLEKFEFDF